MKFLSILALASSALAAPIQERQYTVTDADILQFALTLEHLENYFYDTALKQFTKAQFEEAGFHGRYYENLQYIAHDEASHVELLTAALSAAGATPVAPCTYTFPYTDPRSFVTLSSVLEGVGTSAYLGAAGLISSKTYLGVAGAILATEAIHTSLQRYSIKEIAPANPYATGLGINEVYTLAASFITSCPSTNTPLPVTAFPALTLTESKDYAVNSQAVFTTKAWGSGSAFITFISGLDITSVPVTDNGGQISATIPATASGQTYAVLTLSNVTGTLTDSDVVAGPAIIEVIPAPPTY